MSAVAAEIVGEVGDEVDIGIAEMAGAATRSGTVGQLAAYGAVPSPPSSSLHSSEISAAVAVDVMESVGGGVSEEVEAAAAPAAPTMMSREARDLILSEGGLDLWKVRGVGDKELQGRWDWGQGATRKVGLGNGATGKVGKGLRSCKEGGFGYMELLGRGQGR